MQDIVLSNEEKEYQYKFSIVMAVYNVEPFLNEAVDSLLKQTIGFEENVQLILVDDGSPDQSGIICDDYKEQYPNNIIAIHKENGGVSSARNEGLKYIKGRYVNFMDSDDKLSENALEEVYQFFVEHENETDVVAIPMYFFDGQTGDHILNYKFKKENQVVDLRREYTFVQLSLPSAFITRDRAVDVVFDINLKIAEDAKEMLKLLSNKMTLGLVSSGKYFYRRRTQGEQSAIQKSELNINWYIPYLQRFVEMTIRYYVDGLGYLPKFVQYALMYDLQWKVKQKKMPNHILTEIKIMEYYQLLFKIISKFDDEIILKQKSLDIEYKVFLLRKKYNMFPKIIFCNFQPLMHINDIYLTNLAYNKIVVEFIELNDNDFILEGYAVLIPYSESPRVEVLVRINDRFYETKAINRNKNISCAGETILLSYGFKAVIPVNCLDIKNNIRIFMKVDNIIFEKKKLSWGSFSPISNKYINQYLYKKPWLLFEDENSIYLNKVNLKECLKQECRFLGELLKAKKRSNLKAVLARTFYHIFSIFKKKKIWLLSDRIMKADDNGEALFKYLVEKRENKVIYYFILKKGSADYKRLKDISKNILNHFSFKHKFIFLLSDYIISSHADEITINPFGNYFDLYRDIMHSKRFIFLQHGITKDDISDWLNRYNKNITGFITAAVPEYNSILHGNYGYTEKNIWLTGFPRYDRLIDKSCNKITIMPTWRKYLMQLSNPELGYWNLTDEFFKSEFFINYRNLLNNRRLLSAAERLGYKIQFMPHPTLQPHIDHFMADSTVQILGIENSYQKIFSESSLVITDYSSAVFDFAYLRKPVVYLQDDKEEFFGNGHVYTKGYFDYEENGFGEICYNLETLIDLIIEYMENDCKLKEKYRQRIDNFFAYNDQNNCQRVYEEISKLN